MRRSANLTDKGKICLKCGIEKPLSEYKLIRSSRRPNGYTNPYCNDCHKERQREYIRKVCRTDEYRSKQNQYLRTKARVNAETKCAIHSLICIVCGKLFTSRSRLNTICSDQCKEARKLELSRLCRERKDRYANCILCGNQFKLGKSLRYKFCSDECCKKYGTIYRREYTKTHKRQRANPGHRQRAIKNGVVYMYINRIKVFKRDKWICQICGKKLSEKNIGTNKHNAPELDHIIPLSRGGPHTYSNVQCACRKCNGEKSNNIYDNQQFVLAV